MGTSLFWPRGVLRKWGKLQKRQMRPRGYDPVLKTSLAARKSLGPIDPNVRNKTWMSRDISVYANNEYVFAAFPIARALFCDKGKEKSANQRL